MTSSFLQDLKDEIYHHMPTFNPSGSYVTLGIGAGILVCCRFYLSSRYARCKNKELLNGKTFVITGSTSGIGQAVAKDLARRNGNIIIACRDVQKGSKTALMIRNSVPHPVNVSVYHLDLASMDSIRQFAFELNKNSVDIDILVNNAGLFGAPFTLSQDGYELHFAVNHLGSFLLTHLLLPRMKNKPDARIVMVSSALYKRSLSADFQNFNDEKNFTSFNAYSLSKLANIMFTLELSKRLPKGITINAMHPGIVFTDLARYRIGGNVFLRYLYNIFGTLFLRSSAVGAQTIIHMVTEPSLKGVSGKYFGECRVEELKENAKDERVAEKLFELSEQLCGVNYKTVL
ncbi:retinol dehydrogenase 14-like [Clytia hemisphaerica]|uniref:Uncharacterized protein n=1 Tax=Clytia hemisphaerica TaxID=252671 RepID=A0A7M5X1X6_9CNID